MAKKPSLTKKKQTKQKTEIALEVKNVSKSFRLPTEQASGIKQAFVNWTRGIKGYKEQKVLQDISFQVEKGDFFGIVGRNGSGKSTLLKLISQIYTPDKGQIKVNGKLVPFIELGVGFNPELTGRENVYLNGALLGFSHEEVSAMYEEIVEFAELEEFMDQKLKNYSSGMQVRLAFSIAIKADADVLVLDEVLAVGDAAFQRKCFNYFAHLKKEKKTVILVTHSMEHVTKFCNKAMLIDKDHETIVGTPMDVSMVYRRLNMPESDSSKEDSNIIGSAKDKIDINVDYTNSGKRLDFDINVNSRVEMKDSVLTFVISRDTGEMVYRWVTDESIEGDLDFDNGGKFNLNLSLENIFPEGGFSVQVGIKSRDRSKDYIVANDIVSFSIINSSKYTGNIYWNPDTKFTVKG